jgi:hypothetical protein
MARASWVANAKLGEPPHERQDIVASNAERFSKRMEVAILTTSQLFEALRLEQLGQFNPMEFWDKVFDASGLVDLPGATPGQHDHPIRPDTGQSARE